MPPRRGRAAGTRGSEWGYASALIPSDTTSCGLFAQPGKHDRKIITKLVSELRIFMFFHRSRASPSNMSGFDNDVLN